MGVVGREPGGLKESLGVFRKHHIEVGEALLNISGVGTKDGKPVDKDDPRIPYAHQDFPIMLYHADGRYEAAAGKPEMKALLDKGFRDQPYPPVRIYVADPAVEKQQIMQDNAALRAQLAVQAEATEKLLARLQALENQNRKAS
jgi:hypothetical protein